MTVIGTLYIITKSRQDKKTNAEYSENNDSVSSCAETRTWVIYNKEEGEKKKRKEKKEKKKSKYDDHVYPFPLI